MRVEPTLQLTLADVSPARRRLLGLLLAATAAAIALLASGCGGPSPEERFAEAACSATLPRAQEMVEIFDDVRHIRATPGPDGVLSLLGPIHRGKEVARKLGDEVRAVPVPDTDSGRKAAAYLEDFARLTFTRLAAEEGRVRNLGPNITLLQSIRALNDLEIALVEAFVTMTGHDLIKTRIPELAEPFEKADSCKELDALETG